MISCQSNKHEFKSLSSLNEFLNDIDNGFIQKDQSNQFQFEARLIPPMEGDSASQVSVQLRISDTENTPVLDYGNITNEQRGYRENYFSFEIKNDVFLEFDGKKVYADFNHFEKNYGLKNSIDILFNFTDIKPESDVFFVYRDQVFDQGLIKIKFNKQLFKNCYVKS